VRSSLLVRVEPSADPAAERARLGLRWWRELLYVAVFYLVYSAIRNQFGSAAVSPDRALDHARLIIDIERGLHLFFEETVQSWFVTASADGTLHFGPPGGRPFLAMWNIFYGTFHFVVTAVAMLWLFRRFPDDYAKWRNTLAFTTGFALLGFALFPLMPPRLLTDCGEWGACLDSFGFVDTLAEVGGLWSFDSGTMQKVSNQYAAMPSLHFAWSSWCFLVLYPRLHRSWARTLAALYPLFTLWAIVVTANHYWLDALGGAVILAVGYVFGSHLARFNERRRLGRELHQPDSADALMEEGFHPMETTAPGMAGTPRAGYGADTAGGQPPESNRRPSVPHVPGDDQQPR
jgi:hypothetical protein